MNRSHQRGFTLIELVVVIVILGILAAFAVPKFMGLEGQARAAAVQSMAGSLESADSMAHGVQEASGLGPNAPITVNGVAVTMVNGYPTANTTGIVRLLQDTSGFMPAGFATGKFEINADPTGNCWVKYNAAASATTPPTLTYFNGAALNKANC